MKPKDFVTLLLSMLPREPRSYDKTECEIVTTFLRDVFSEYPEMPLIQTGWYDPFEDTRNKETDDYSGFNYIQFE